MSITGSGLSSADRLRREIVARRLAGLATARTARIPQVDRGGVLPVSFAQERLWFLERMSERGDEYLLWFSWRVRGGLDQAAWQGALDDVVARHEVLRTALEEVDGLPVQRVAAAVSVPVLWCQVPAADTRAGQLAAAREAARKFARQRFDLASAPLVRAGVWVLDPRDCVAVVAFHHVATDGWSGRIFLRELTEFYQGRLAGTPAVLAPLAVQYGDFAVWQRQWLSGGVLEQQLAYWREALSGVRVLELPADRARPPVRSGRGGGVELTFPAGLVTSLEELGRRQGATLFMVLLAVFQVVLGRWSGQRDFAVGTPAAGRSRLELEDLIGFFVNTLVIRGDLSGNPTFAEFLGRVRESVLGAFDHQEVPFERLVEELRPERDLSRNPLFQAWLALQNYAPADEHEGPDGFEYLQLEPKKGFAPFDISLLAYPDPAGDGMVGRFIYDSDLFDESPVVRLAGHVRRVLETVAADPGARVWEIGLVSPDEQSGLLDLAGPDGGTEGPGVLPLVCALPAGGGPAVACGDQAVSYSELETMIGGLTAELTARGATRGSRIGACLRRGTWSVAAILATWRTGATYIPLDPAFPPERLRYMTTEAAITLTITDTTTTPLAATLGTQPVPVETTRPAPAATGTPPHPRDLAYIIFTSGSTGTPKPVGIEHAALARHITAATAYYNITPADRVLAFASLSFDASLEQILPALTTGAQLTLRPDEHWLPAQLPALISRHHLTVANLPPAYWAELVSSLTPQAAAQLATLRLLILGGETVPAHCLPAWTALAPHVRLINAYGPTEAVITATACDITRAPGDRSAPIGRPLPGRRAYITDPRGHLLPPGVPGELLIAGPALARGYLGHPALTAQKFTPDPHAGDGTRLYHTGDLARWLPDGNLEYLGRTDNQIKIRGFRIEPGEIEAVMSRCPGIAAAAIAIRADRHGGPILVGYYVSQSADQVQVPVLREWCARYLPDFMRPSQVVPLAVLPVTAGGKLDRAALPEVTPDGAAVKAEYVAPRDETERMIARIWTEVLGVEQVGIDDGFFDLGGHSLLATMAVSRIAARLGREVQLRALFENPRIRDFGPLVAAARRTVTASVVPVDRGGVLPVSFAQERLWFLERMSERGDEYLLWFSWRVRGGLDQAAWQGALDDVVARHEVLRTALEEVDGLPVQRVAAAVSVPVLWCQVPAADTRAGQLAAAREAARKFARQRFDLASAPLVRAGVWVLDPRDCVAVVAFHHVATDGWSGRIFLRELTEFYQGRLAGTPAVLAPLAVQYGDFAVWQRQWLSGGVLEQQLAYWREALSGVRVLELPADRARPPVRSGRGGGVELTFPAGLVTSLEELGRRQGATLFMVLLAVFQVVLGRWSGQRDFAVGTPAAGRSRLELEDLIGFFVNTLVIRGDLSGNPTFAEFLGRVRESVLGAFDHQEVPFERLVEELRPERDLSRNPLFQAMFDLQESATPTPLIAGLEFEPVSQPWEIAKFDLTANFLVRGSRLALAIEYDSDLFDESPVVRLAGHVRRVLETVAADPGARVWEIGLVSPDERSELLDLADLDAGPDVPGVLPLVCALPGAAGDPALACGDQVVSYSELENLVGGLTAELTARGATRGSRIGACLRRGTWSVAAILATWRTGATYIPLDPAFPPERLRYMTTEAAITLTITDTTTTPLAATLGTQPVPVETTRPAPAATGTPPHPRDLAYIIFTSGSTGTPKPVGIEHAALARHITAATAYYNITPADRVLAFASLSFDASLEQILPALTTGAQLTLRPDEVWTAETLASQVRARNVTVMELTPSYLAELTTRLDTLAAELATLRLLVTGGEILPPEVTRAWFKHLPSVQIINTYGPTEAAISASAYRLTAPVTTRSVPIGRALPGRHIYIVDSRDQLVPPGIPGELLIGGTALARGYLSQPALTAERFSPDPFTGNGSRLYRTGDLARWLPDGNLEYLGRTDNQVKIRGFRIELGEIEAALGAFPGARGAAVLVRKIHGEPSLIGYVAGSGLETKALEAWCRRLLPDYMVPVVLTVLDALPLTVQGKVDSGALPAPELLAAAEYVAPQSPTEVVIAQIWVELLGVSQVGLRDNFFALGGHSLRAVSATSRLRAAFGCPIDVRHLFEHPTVEDLSAEVERLLIEQISAMSEDDIGLSLMADPPTEGPGRRES